MREEVLIVIFQSLQVEQDPPLHIQETSKQNWLQLFPDSHPFIPESCPVAEPNPIHLINQFRLALATLIVTSLHSSSLSLDSARALMWATRFSTSMADSPGSRSR